MLKNKPYKVSFTATHPVDGNQLCYMERSWCPWKAMQGFYSNKVYRCVIETARLIAGFSNKPLGVKKPNISIKLHYQHTPIGERGKSE